jgi:membrane protein involved in colicin uptake
MPDDPQIATAKIAADRKAAEDKAAADKAAADKRAALDPRMSMDDVVADMKGASNMKSAVSVLVKGLVQKVTSIGSDAEHLKAFATVLTASEEALVGAMVVHHEPKKAGKWVWVDEEK